MDIFARCNKGRRLASIITTGQKGAGMATNPRWKGGQRRTYQKRFRAMGLPCAICGREIDYSIPYYYKDKQGNKRVNMWAFVIDEKQPISKWQEAGYCSKEQAAQDFNNLQPAHAICNARKYNKQGFTLQKKKTKQETKQYKPIASDGKW